MSSIDNRVVQMQFNNREFEKGVSTSKKSIEDLDKALNNLGKADTSAIGRALSGVGDAANGVGDKFNAMATVVQGALLKIGAEIANVGLKLTESLTVEPLIEGWQKYETIVSNTAGLYNIGLYLGNDYEEILEYIAKIQWYADATSFSMDAMTSAYLAAVNAGTGMGEAVEVIMGLGNAFMYAGATATEMDGAFAMFSKVMQDEANLGQAVYRSLEQVYRIITPQLKEQFINTALEMGKIDEVTAKTISADFKASLADKWLTGDIVKQVFSVQYGEYASSVYAFSKAWTYTSDEVSDGVKKLAEEMGIQRGEVLTTTQAMELYDQSVKDAGGEIDEFGRRTFESAMEAKKFSEVIDAIKDGVSSQWAQIYTAIFGDYLKAKELFTNLNDYFAGVFVDPIANLADLVKKWMAFETVVAESGETITGRDTFLKIFVNIKDAIEKIIIPIKKAWASVFSGLQAETLVTITSNIEKFTNALIISDEAAEKLQHVFSILFKVLDNLLKIIGGIVMVLKNLFGVFKPIFTMIGSVNSILADSLINILDWITNLGLLEQVVTWASKAFNKFKYPIEEFFKVFQSGESIFYSVRDSIGEFGFSFNSAKDILDKFLTKLVEVSSELEGKTLTSIENFGTSVKDSIVGAFTGVIGTFSKIMEWINKLFDKIKNNFGEIITWIKETVKSIAKGLSEIIITLFSATNKVVEEEVSLLQKYRDKVTGKNSLLDNIFEIIKNILGIFKDILGLKILNNFEKMTKSISIIPKILNTVLGGIADTFKAYQKTLKAEAIESIAKSLIMLAGALFILSLIDSEKIWIGVGAMSAMLAAIAGFLKIVDNIETDLKKGLGSSISKLGIGMFFVQLGATLVLVATAIKMISDVAKEGNLEDALGAIFLIITCMAGIMAALYGLQKSGLKDLTGLNDSGVMFVKMASAMLIIAKAIAMLSEIKNIQQGVLAMVEIMGAMVMFLALMKIVSGFNNASIGYKALGLFFVEMALGLTIIAGAVSLMAAAAKNEKQFTAAVNALTTIMGVLALCMIAVGQLTSPGDMLAFGAAITIVAIGMTMMAGAIALMALIPVDIMTTTLGYMADIIAGLVVAAAIMSMSGSSGKDLVLLGASLMIIAIGMSAMIKALGMMALLDQDKMKSNLIILGTIMGLVAGLGVILSALGAGTILLGLAAAFYALGKGMIMFVTALMMLELIPTETIGEKIVALIATLVAVIVESGDVIAEGIVALFDIAWKAVLGCLVSFVTNFLDSMRQIFQAIYTAMGGEGEVCLLDAIAFIWGKVKDFVASHWREWAATLIGIIGNIIGKLVEKLKELATKFKEAGKNAIMGIIEGFKSKITDAVNSIKNVGQRILDGFKNVLGIKSPSKKFAEAAKYCVEGFSNGLKNNSDTAINSAESLADATIAAFSNELEDNMDTEMVITPILDLSNIQNEKTQLDGILNTDNLRISANSIGITNPTNSLLEQMDELKAQLNILGISNNSESIADIFAKALSGVNVYMDRNKVGKLISDYQYNIKRAGGI